MAKFYGKASKYLKGNTLIEKYATVLWRALLIVTLYLILVKNIDIFFSQSLIGLLVILIMFGPIIWFIIYQIKQRSISFTSFRNGQKGEGAVWYELRKLSDKFIVFQDIKIGERGNIDFVVLGPTGLFVLEVKSHRGIINFNGIDLLINNKFFEKDILKQTMAGALNLRDYLLKKTNQELFIDPVLVFSNYGTRVHFGLNRVKNIFVIQKRYLKKLIYSQPEKYSQELISKIENELKNLVIK